LNIYIPNGWYILKEVITVKKSNNIRTEEARRHFILTGNLWKVMLQLSWATVLGMVLYGLNVVLDAFFVGRFVGETALAGVSIASNLSNMSTALGSMIGVGAGSLLSIAIGSKDESKQMKLMGNVNLVGLAMTAVYMVFGLAFSKPLIAFMGGTGEVLALGNDYFRVTVIGAVFWIGGIAGNMLIRSEGRMKTAAWMMGVGLAANAFCNYIFIVLMGMGVAGAAWGTNVGMFVYTLVGWLYFGTGKASFKTKTLSLKPDGKIAGEILRLGVPALIMSVMTLVQGVIVFNVLSRYGTNSDIAFYGVAFRLFSFLLTPCLGLMRAAQPVIGINYGAKQYDRVIRAYKVFVYASLILTVPFWAASIIAPGAILGTMLPEQILTGNIAYFRIYMAIVPVMSLVYMPMTLFPSIGKAKPAAIIGIVRQLFLYVPAMLLLPTMFGVGGVYCGSLAIDVIVLVVASVMVRKEFSSLKTRFREEEGIE
jgi:putative MATE family efflux protein